MAKRELGVGVTASRKWRYAGPHQAFMVGREFCHLHPPGDGGLHLHLPLDVARTAIDKGWAENHPIALRGRIRMNVVMVYGPGNQDEVEVVKWLVAEFHAFAPSAEAPN